MLKWLMIAIVGVFVLSICGCQAISKADTETLRANFETGVQAVQKLGVEADGDLFLSPNGSISTGPGLSYTNGSYARIRVRMDPTKRLTIREAQE